MTLEEQVAELTRKVSQLQQRRVTQEMYVPGSIKSRHLGEANRFVMAGLTADRPVTPSPTSLGTAIWFSTDTFVLSIWTGEVWKNVTLT